MRARPPPSLRFSFLSFFFVEGFVRKEKKKREGGGGRKEGGCLHRISWHIEKLVPVTLSLSPPTPYIFVTLIGCRMFA